MSDLRYLIMCNGPDGRPDKIGYHCSEPEDNGVGGHRGGFESNIADAIVHENPIFARLERKRLADIYLNYTMSIKSISAKELFKTRLKG